MRERESLCVCELYIDRERGREKERETERYVRYMKRNRKEKVTWKERNRDND